MISGPPDFLYGIDSFGEKAGKTRNGIVKKQSNLRSLNHLVMQILMHSVLLKHYLVSTVIMEWLKLLKIHMVKILKL